MYTNNYYFDLLETAENDESLKKGGINCNKTYTPNCSRTRASECHVIVLKRGHAYGLRNYNLSICYVFLGVVASSRADLDVAAR